MRQPTPPRVSDPNSPRPPGGWPTTPTRAARSRPWSTSRWPPASATGPASPWSAPTAIVETAASSDELVEQADALQYALNEGPCLRAAEHGGLYVIADTATDPRWPLWGPAVARLGLHSVLSVNLFTDHRVLGALNLYYQPRDEFSEDDVEVARVVAAHASVALARVRAEQDLWKAVDSRHLIGQAQGVLMERFALSPGAGVLGAAPVFAAAQHQAVRRRR